MNKIFKAVAIIGNVSEVIIASAMVADFISKLRGNKSTASITVVEDSNPQPDQPIAA